MGTHAITPSRMAQIKADFLRSMANGWSISVAISHAGAYDSRFRKMFSEDSDIQRIIADNRSRRWIRGSGLSYIHR